MVLTIEKVLRRYGSLLTLYHGGKTITFRGFLQHSGSRSWYNMEPRYSPLGKIPRGKYILLAPVHTEILVGDTLDDGSAKVTVRRIETVKLGDESVYLWGLCEEKGGEELWASPL